MSMPRTVEGRIALVPMACELCGHPAEDEPAVVIVTKEHRKRVWLCTMHTEAIGRGSSTSRMSLADHP
jgi:hypothetical protein